MAVKIKINDTKIKCLDMRDVNSTLIVAENFNNEKIQIIIKGKQLSSKIKEKETATYIYGKLQNEYNSMVSLLGIGFSKR